jgi:hypothetical protein
MRQLAGYLTMPVFNEPAEALLGRRFDEVGEMPKEVWS